MQACTKNTRVNGAEKRVGGDGPDRMQRFENKSHVRGQWTERRSESAPRDGDGDGAEERVWVKVWGKQGAASRPAAKKRAGTIP